MGLDISWDYYWILSDNGQGLPCEERGGRKLFLFCLTEVRSTLGWIFSKFWFSFLSSIYWRHTSLVVVDQRLFIARTLASWTQQWNTALNFADFRPVQTCHPFPQCFKNILWEQSIYNQAKWHIILRKKFIASLIVHFSFTQLSYEIYTFFPLKRKTKIVLTILDYIKIL